MPADLRATEVQDAPHLWRHFADMAGPAPQVFVEGEGSYLIDDSGNRYLDALSNLYCVNLGYSYGAEMGRAAFSQYCQLGYHSSWGSTHPKALELAERLSTLAPAGLDHVFLTPSGGESVEAAWKLCRAFALANGEDRWKVISRQSAYHGTTLGALALNGLDHLREQFAPMLIPSIRTSNTRRLFDTGVDSVDDGVRELLDELEQQIIANDPSTIAALIVEPVQNHGGMLTAPPSYFAGLRRLCDAYGLLLVADETITAFGRCGEWFASARFGLAPDIIVTAKGLSSAHAVMGAVIASDRVFAPFLRPGSSFLHGNTFGGHPVMAAVALKNLEIMERIDLPGQVKARQTALEKGLRSLLSLDVVHDVRGAGYLWAIELVSASSDAPHGRHIWGPLDLEKRLHQLGVLTRVAFDDDIAIINVAPPLVAEQTEFDIIVDALRSVLRAVSAQAQERRDQAVSTTM
ncbi:aminotransferase class III-fold pyridoxal phosphate-dependent enzyme [Microbacterium profundi]|uniref:aminotransferase class III-fold pyridoxal phosphate-dependent enzyme n=1 Tax=Microbacterium profundi TaxID=450380 RepID=UPI00068D5C8F|nr:aminotransferase class III-fold pyridoxal phosphate-dependent enzyme [Microbacterium profundi]